MLLDDRFDARARSLVGLTNFLDTGMPIFELRMGFEV
jgi:hypothetical protein